MDIKHPTPQQTQSFPLFSVDKTSSINLNLNEQHTAKIISNNINTQEIILNVLQVTRSIQVKSDFPIEAKPGQTVQLLVTKTDPVEFTLLPNNSDTKTSYQPTKPIILTVLALKQPTTTKPAPPSSLSQENIISAQNKVNKQTIKSPLISQANIINAQVISIHKDNIQLKIHTSSDKPSSIFSQIQSTEMTELKKLNKKSTNLPPSFVEKFKNIKDHTIITLKKENILPANFQVNPNNLKTLSPHLDIKSGQTIQLVKIDEDPRTPKYQIIDSTPNKIIKGQIIQASVLDLKNNKIHLQIKNLTNNELPFSTSKTDSTITLNIKQLKNLSNKSTSFLNTHNLKHGQIIKLQVTKVGTHPEFNLIKNEHLLDPPLKIKETIKQLLPIQEPTSELVNQLTKTLATINKNKTVSENLKRLAKEILDNIPRLNDKKIDPKQLKKYIHNSGLFLEKKLSYPTEKNNHTIQVDIKNQLLKLHHVLKQELDINSQQRLHAGDVDLLKEMFQKTESSLAKIVLNQLNSLPKEDGVKQGWILDLPFLNQDIAESVRVEINRESDKKEKEKQDIWAVTITITPPGFETIHCKVSFFNQTINTRFWSETEDVANKISKNLDYLKTQFELSGIETGHMSVQTGIPKEQAEKSTINQNLFNQKV